MADSWYYVQKGNRHGPVAVEVIQQMISNSDLNTNDYVWKKGFENWKKIKEVPELEESPQAAAPAPAPEPEPEPTPAPAPAASTFKAPEPKPAAAAPQQKMEYKEINLSSLSPEERIIFVRIGNDRGGAASDYGPFSVNQLRQLLKENRINGKTLFFMNGMKEWKVLADVPEYQEIFEESPPVIKDADRRVAVRKPFVARLFVQNNKKVFEGICRDISIGGMQILTDEFKGQPGDRISINVHPDNSDYHFTASGVVVRILNGNSGFSFRFQGLTDDARKAVEKYLQEN
ncbi:MAG: GYF domain-containing protein [Bacteriovoracaceae bacterium]